MFFGYSWRCFEELLGQIPVRKTEDKVGLILMSPVVEPCPFKVPFVSSQEGLVRGPALRSHAYGK